jgi:hypothetical protein
MRDRELVLNRYPEAEAVEEVLPDEQSSPTHRCCWFVYDGPDLDARVLGRGISEDHAWTAAARTVSLPRRRLWALLAD